LKLQLYLTICGNWPGTNKSNLDPRVVCGPGRNGSGDQQKNHDDEGQGQAAGSPIHKKIFHSESIKEEFGQRLG
jgi:hypothetical protein